MIRVFKIIAFSILGILAFFVLMLIHLGGIRWLDVRSQNRYMKQLQSKYQNYIPIDETQFVNFDLNDETIALNEIQLLASHNSYKKTGSEIGKFFVGLGDSFAEAKSLRYGYRHLTEQFEHGIRSQEWDVRYQNNGFQINHVPLVDNSSVAPQFDKALEEVALYSEHNPHHIPIIILIELKNDWMMLNPLLKNIGANEIQLLDKLIEEKLGNRLFKPSDMINSSLTLRETIENNGWPSVHALLGKVLFVLHPGFATDTYYALDETLSSQTMFIGVDHNNLEQPYAAFVVHNNPSPSQIQPMIEAGFIVRTRIDSGLQFDDQIFEQAVWSGAQILTTDFSIARSDLNVRDVIYLNQTKTVILRQNEEDI